MAPQIRRPGPFSESGHRPEGPRTPRTCHGIAGTRLLLSLMLCFLTSARFDLYFLDVFKGPRSLRKNIRRPETSFDIKSCSFNWFHSCCSYWAHVTPDCGHVSRIRSSKKSPAAPHRPWANQVPKLGRISKTSALRTANIGTTPMEI